ncbi:MAG: hypothetical protein NTZ17_09015 [Phycisphaerae bacterium]|nr:hypothetical protein [Phycisphaerae bacterium]
MRPMYNDREPQPTATKEPLVDINVTPPESNEPRKGSRSRRKRLSDIETEDGRTQPPAQDKPQSRPTLAGREAGEPRLEPQSQPDSQHPRLVDITAAPQGLELRPRAGRPRLAVALSAEEVPGLQSILDLPCAAGSMTASGQNDIELALSEQRAKQSFSLALAGGLAAAAVGAMAWTLITMAVSHQIGWMAMAVGLLVGGTVRMLGRGIAQSFGYLGVTLTVLGCLLGNLLSVCTLVAGQQGLSTPAVLAHVCRNPVLIPATMIATFRSMDLLFYGIALYEGYRFSFRRVNDAR